MNQFRLSLAATILVLIFSVPAAAGDIQCGIAVQPAGQAGSGDVLAGETAAGKTTYSETATVDMVKATAMYLTLNAWALF